MKKAIGLVLFSVGIVIIAFGIASIFLGNFTEEFGIFIVVPIIIGGGLLLVVGRGLDSAQPRVGRKRERARWWPIVILWVLVVPPVSFLLVWIFVGLDSILFSRTITNFLMSVFGETLYIFIINIAFAVLPLILTIHTIKQNRNMREMHTEPVDNTNLPF